MKRRILFAILVLVLSGIFGIVTGGAIREAERQEAIAIREAEIRAATILRGELYHTWALTFEVEYPCIDVVGIMEDDNMLLIFLREEILPELSLQGICVSMAGKSLVERSVPYLVEQIELLGYSPSAVEIGFSTGPLPIEYINQLVHIDLESGLIDVSRQILAVQPEMMMWVGRRV